MNSLSGKKWLRGAIFLGVLMLLFIFLSQIGLARELENQYPKIPLPLPNGIENFSLNDIYDAISGNGPAVGAFKDKPLSALIFYFYTFSIVIVGIVAFGVIIITGVKFMTSGANPGQRKEAMDQLRAVILGIALLLGSVILLNTINPELTILSEPGSGTGRWWGGNTTINFGGYKGYTTPIDIDSLKYGGVVLYAKSNLDGTEGKSDTIFTSLPFNVADYTYMDGNKLGALRILGDCAIRMVPNLAAPDISVLGPISLSRDDPADYSPIFTLRYTEGSMVLFNFNNLGNNCVGHSIMAATNMKLSGNDFTGKKFFIATAPNLNGDQFVPRSSPVNDTIRQYEFARSDLISNSPEEFEITTCENPLKEKNEAESCRTFNNRLGTYILRTSAITLGGNGRNRQAGVVLYAADDFAGKSEVFIASDANFNGNLIGHDQVSSLKIIGKYKVTLYEKDRGDANGGETLIIDNTGNSVVFTNSFTGRGGSESLIQKESNNIVEIKKLSRFFIDENNTWDNKISAIKIEVPKNIFDAQKLERTCIEESPGLCTLGVGGPTSGAPTAASAPTIGAPVPIPTPTPTLNP